MTEYVSLEFLPLSARGTHAHHAVVPIGGPSAEDASEEDDLYAMIALGQCQFDVLPGVAWSPYARVVNLQKSVDVELGIACRELVDTVGRNVDVSFGHGGIVGHVAHAGGNIGKARKDAKVGNHSVE